MVCSLTKDELLCYIRTQADYFFPDRYPLEGQDVKIAFDVALDRLEVCLDAISIHGYHNKDGNVVFSHLHGDQYATLLYFFGNSLWAQSENIPLCDKLLQLNRALFSCFISYKCKLPNIFFLDHPIGTVLGNATYSDYLVVLQGVTVNTPSKVADHPLIDSNGCALPVLGKGLFLGAGATILGSQPIGDRVSIGANVTIYEQEIPDDSIVILKENKISSSSQEKSSMQGTGVLSCPNLSYC